ncbi:MAG: hypothetical protein JW751_02660 [Polyangiaceae bacterium]|nr:hypothetical protein [Polyangiaceae bacterium]
MRVAPESVHGNDQFGVHFVGVLHVRHDLDLATTGIPEAAQRRREVRRDPHRQGHGGPCPDAHDVNVSDACHPLEDWDKLFIRKAEGIATGDQDLSDGGVATQEGQCLLHGFWAGKRT